MNSFPLVALLVGVCGCIVGYTSAVCLNAPCLPRCGPGTFAGYSCGANNENSCCIPYQTKPTKCFGNNQAARNSYCTKPNNPYDTVSGGKTTYCCASVTPGGK